MDIVFLIAGILAATSVGSIGITLILIASGDIRV